MDGATVSATVLPLVGVALGTAGTLTGQYLATRAETRRHAVQRVSELRAERKAAIVAFLDAAQSAEKVIDRRGPAAPIEDPASTEALLHSLWLSKKLLELVCTTELARIAHSYTSTLHSLIEPSQTPPGKPADPVILTPMMRELRGAFMNGARRELGVSGDDVYR